MTVRVSDVIDSPEFLREIARIDYESDLRILRIYQRGNIGPVPKALWRRIIRARKAGL